MRCIAVVFSEAGCELSADQRSFCAKTDHFHNAFVHTLFVHNARALMNVEGHDRFTANVPDRVRDVSARVPLFEFRTVP